MAASRFRKAILAVAFVPLLIVAGRTLSIPVYDFCEYWAAGWLATHHQNPYSYEALFTIQRSLGLDLPHPVMMLNPPWTLSFAVLTSLLPFRIAQLLWMLVAMAIVFYCADWLWHYYGGETKLRWIALVVAAAFAPTVTCLKIGHPTPLMLLGLVLFLKYEASRPFLAGISLLLLGFKPHFLYLVALSMIVDSVLRRRWRFVLGAAFWYALGMAVALLLDPTILKHYFELTSQHFGDYRSAFGGTLRWMFGQEHRWLQFVPSVFGFAWFAMYGRRKATREYLPELALASVITTSYGWSYDQVVLLVAVIPAAVIILRTRNTAALAVLILTDAALFAMNQARLDEYWMVWSAPAWALAYWLATREDRVKLRQPAREILA